MAGLSKSIFYFFFCILTYRFPLNFYLFSIIYHLWLQAKRPNKPYAKETRKERGSLEDVCHKVSQNLDYDVQCMSYCSRSVGRVDVPVSILSPLFLFAILDSILAIVPQMVNIPCILPCLCQYTSQNNTHQVHLELKKGGEIKCKC